MYTGIYVYKIYMRITKYTCIRIQLYTWTWGIRIQGYMYTYIGIYVYKRYIRIKKYTCILIQEYARTWGTRIQEYMYTYVGLYLYKRVVLLQCAGEGNCVCGTVCCSVLQCVAVCFSVLQCVEQGSGGGIAVASQSIWVAVLCSVLWCVAVCCRVVQCVVVCCMCCSLVQCVAPFGVALRGSIEFDAWECVCDGSV